MTARDIRMIACTFVFLCVMQVHCDVHVQSLEGEGNSKSVQDLVLNSYRAVDITQVADAMQFETTELDDDANGRSGSGNCINDVGLIALGLKSRNTIAMKFVDAASKIPSGLFQGNTFWMGDYQECLSIPEVDNPSTKQSFKGKYFTLGIHIQGFPLPVIHFGVCLPDSCDENEAMGLATTAFQTLKNLQPAIASVNVTVSSAYSRPNNEIKGGVIASIVITVILVFLVCIGTLLAFVSSKEKGSPSSIQNKDAEQNVFVVSQSNEGSYTTSDKTFTPTKTLPPFPTTKAADLLKAFSFVENSKKLFGTSTAKGPLACLNGLRVLSMWWVILGHTYELGFNVLDNPLQAQPIAQRFTSQAILNATLSVDTFFFLSGLLVAFLAMKEINKRGRMNWVYFVVHRFWRLTPTYAFVMLIFVTMTRLAIDSPYSFMLDKFGPLDSCHKYWWANFLYINNMYPFYGDLQRMCMSWSWYLANDMQFYLILSPIVILLFWKARRFGIFLTICLMLGGIASRVYLVLYYGIYGPNNAISKHMDDPWGKYGSIYVRPYSRWAPYLVGMLTGCYLSFKNLKIRLNKYVALLGWGVAIASGLSVVYGEYYYYHNPGENMSKVASVLYISLNRAVWSICLSWIVVACVADKGGPIKHILSWAFWAPLGRLTYAAYLVHPALIVLNYYNLTTPLHFRDYTMVYMYIGNLVVSYGVAFVVSMIIEAPMIQLEKTILSMKNKRS